MNMFKHHILFGVGLDRYGENYRKYRDVLATLRRGPDLVSNAAHNVFIQLAATGGIFVLLTYTALTVFIFWRGAIAMKFSRGASQLAVATVYAAWIAYFAQSVISIDNLGVAIWGWVLGGIVIGISFVPTENGAETKAANGGTVIVSRKRISPELSYVISGLLAIGMLILVTPLIMGDKEITISSALQLPSTAQQAQYFMDIEERPLHNIFVDPASVLVISGKLAEGSVPNGATTPNATLLNESERLLINLLKQDKNNYEVNTTLAEIYEQTGSPVKAIPMRAIDSAQDPDNTANWLQYGKDLKAAGETSKLPAVISAIDAIDPKGSDAQKAHSELM
jgi:hypothetical protein